MASQDTILAIGNTSFLTATPAALAWCRDTFGFSFGSLAPIIASAREQLHVLKVFLRSVSDVCINLWKCVFIDIKMSLFCVFVFPMTLNYRHAVSNAN